jgi:hypothetical protein
METQPPIDTAMETQPLMDMETESPMEYNATVPPTLPPPVHEDWSNSTTTEPPSVLWDTTTSSPMPSDVPSCSPSVAGTTTDAPSFPLALPDDNMNIMPTPSPPFMMHDDNATMVPMDENVVPSHASCEIDFDTKHETLLLQTVINVPIYIPAAALENKRTTTVRNSYVSIVCTLPDHGDLTLQSNGTIAYHPHVSFVGTDEFWILRCLNGNGGGGSASSSASSSSSATASSESNDSGSFSSATSTSRSSSNGGGNDCRVQQYSVTVVSTASETTMRTRDSDSPRLRRRRFWTSTGIMALVFGLAVAVIVLACLLAFCCHREHTKSLVRESVSGNSSDSTNPTDPSSAPPHSPMALSPIAEAPAAETAVMATAATAARHSVLWDRLSGVGQRLFRPVVVAEPGPQPLPVFKDQTRHCTAAASAEMMAVIPNRLRRARPEASLGEGRPEFPPYRATTPSSLTTPTTVGGCMRSDRSDPPRDKEFRALTDKDDLASANSMPMVTAVAMSETEECTNEDEDNGEEEYMF